MTRSEKTSSIFQALNLREEVVNNAVAGGKENIPTITGTQRAELVRELIEELTLLTVGKASQILQALNMRDEVLNPSALGGKEFKPSITGTDRVTLINMLVAELMLDATA